MRERRARPDANPSEDPSVDSEPMSAHDEPGKCELCPELRGELHHRFARIYGVGDRIAMRTPRFAAMPTLGQLFVGSTVVLPFDHVETLAAMPRESWDELVLLVERVRTSVAGGGPTILFEHGSTRPAAGACGIYHAHLHVVPVPGPLTAQQLLVADQSPTRDMTTALTFLRDSAHYAWAQGTDGRFAARAMDDAPNPLPSQHLRRILTTHFELSQPWDWRVYKRPQPEMAQALGLLARC